MQVERRRRIRSPKMLTGTSARISDSKVTTPDPAWFQSLALAVEAPDEPLESEDVNALRRRAENRLAQIRALQRELRAGGTGSASSGELRALMSDLIRIVKHLEGRLSEAPWADGALAGGIGGASSRS